MKRKTGNDELDEILSERRGVTILQGDTRWQQCVPKWRSKLEVIKIILKANQWGRAKSAKMILLT